jgi:inward rectifier potassium channel
MARVNIRLKSDETTGFGASAKNSSDRYYDDDGQPNVIKKGLKWSEYISGYHYVINMPFGWFLLTILAGYIGINLVFTLVYSLVGIEHLVGIQQGGFMHNFMEIFFFSTQTFTTVGYGRVSPMGMTTNAVATFEAFIGLISFALATGLFYAKFSKPTPHLKFSDIALISPYKDKKALMFRMASPKNNILSDAEVKLTLALKIEENGSSINKFFALDTVISKISLLALSWTVVHEINEKSPLYGFTQDDIQNTKMELLVYVKAFDEAYSNQVIKRTTYLQSEIVYNAKFKIMYYPDQDGNHTVLDFDLINEYEIIN